MCLESLVRCCRTRRDVAQKTRVRRDARVRGISQIEQVVSFDRWVKVDEMVGEVITRWTMVIQRMDK